MPRVLRRVLPFVPLYAALACNPSAPNPFVTPEKTKTPAATDSIVFMSDLYASAPNGLLEAYALNTGTAGTTRLTFCNTSTTICSNLMGSFAPDRIRIALEQVTQDTNGDGKLTEADGAALVYQDLARGVSAPLAPSSEAVAGLDWSPQDTIIVFGAVGMSGLGDLFTIGIDGTNNQDLTNTATISERRPRFDRTGSVAAFERIDSTGKTSAYVLDTAGQEDLIDAGGPGTAPLAGTTYILGSDGDPSFSPDGTQIVFRRLTSVSGTGASTWDILTVHDDGTGLATVATGAYYRGAPDWGLNGITYVEADPAQTHAAIIVVAPDGTNRQVIFTAPKGYTLAAARWIPGS
jgi:Tol biopolymer transport system component